MRYPYLCGSCGYDFEVIKSVRHIDEDEYCKCGKIATRYIGKTDFYGASDWDSASYNPAFGKVIRNRSHLRQEILENRRKGMDFEEIGNEPLEKIHSRMERTRKEISDDRWKKASRELGLVDG